MKEESDAKRQSLDGRHQFIITAIADKLEMNSNEVEDLLLEGNQVNTVTITVTANYCTQLEAMDDFFAPNGAKHLLIYYENTKEVDTGRTGIMTLWRYDNCYNSWWKGR